MFDAMIASHSLLLVNALNIVSTPNIICLKMPDFTMRIWQFNFQGYKPLKWSLVPGISGDKKKG
jgi:hypothetical protein